jgi:hypothetical protein
MKKFEDHEVCSAKDIELFMKEKFDWNPSHPASWISTFCKKHGISSHKTQKRPAKRNRQMYEEEIIKYREQVEEERVHRKHGKVWHMDEAGIYNDATRERSYSPIGTTPQVNTPNDHGRDTIIAAVCENGEKIPLTFIHHKKKRYETHTNQITGERYKVLVDKGISGLNNQLMEDWVDDFLSQPQLNAKKDILCYDNHRSLLTRRF